MRYLVEKLKELRDNGQIEILEKYYVDIEKWIARCTGDREELYKLRDFVKRLILECREEEY